MSTAPISLDNPVFAGRFRDFGRGSHYPNVTRPTEPAPIRDVVEKSAPGLPASLPQNVNSKKPESTVRNGNITATLPVQPRQARSEVLMRNITAPPAKAVMERKTTSQRVMIAMAVVVFLMGSGVAFWGLRANKRVEAQVSAISKQDSSSADEDKPTADAMANYKVEPSLPRYVRINKIDVFARVMREGVDKTGALKAPGNVHDVGWYENSSKPGEAGAMLLDSHVSGPTTKGAFYAIKNLKPGDTIEVERGDGQKFTYSVVRSTVADADQTDMGDAMLPAVDGKPGLNLITCTGAFDAKTSTFKQRIIVFATQV
jgi:sortase (surface protein transpeptidase)